MFADYHIILIPFPFTDLTGVKNRPALILVENDTDITVSFITTQVKWEDEFDFRLESTTENGLKKTSLIRLSKLSTIDKDLVIGRLGRLTDQEMMTVNKNLIKLLRLDKTIGFLVLQFEWTCQSSGNVLTTNLFLKCVTLLQK